MAPCAAPSSSPAMQPPGEAVCIDRVGEVPHGLRHVNVHRPVRVAKLQRKRGSTRLRVWWRPSSGMGRGARWKMASLMSPLWNLAEQASSQGFLLHNLQSIRKQQQRSNKFRGRPISHKQLRLSSHLSKQLLNVMANLFDPSTMRSSLATVRHGSREQNSGFALASGASITQVDIDGEMLVP
ncbi:hypothetical protein OsI_01711 [Oryza sativa Indica Group]|uniref:Uncharacterized protein n=1 Tax=Oryza sativa subsp. indica TaxID=39946 RepID=A2WPD8_ORYSI|nr:hypothetical protein OsI_01711 [Oryza sativa Indica Group]